MLSRWSYFRKIILLVLILFSAVFIFSAVLVKLKPINKRSATRVGEITLTVRGSPWGYSSCFLGAVEGSSRFDIADLRDLGITVYRIYGGMSRWEARNDSTTYGSPTIAQIKASPNIINWAWWDQIMSNPPQGSDYWWANTTPRWQGSARLLFGELQIAGIRPLLVLRNRDDSHKPFWSPDPPETQADWNEWWEHVFATVYWLNVRNHYHVNDFEVHNEPDNAEQGWSGTLDQYLTFGEYTRNAIDFVYKKYLPGQTYRLYGPATIGWSTWPGTLMQKHVNIDSLSVHDYEDDSAPYVQQVHSWMNASGYQKRPLWLSEWGNYTHPDEYDSIPYGIILLNNLIHQSTPGNTYIYGSTLFALYDQGSLPSGLISAQGKRRSDYYAFRMGIRAMQGCQPTYQSIANNPDLLAIATQHPGKELSLLVTNRGVQRQAINVDLSALLSKGQGTLERFDNQHQDTVTDKVQVRNGHLVLALPASGAALLTLLAT